MYYYPLCQLYLWLVANVSNGWFSKVSEVVVVKHLNWSLVLKYAMRGVDLSPQNNTMTLMRFPINCRQLDTLVFENIHFAFQNIASLNALNNDVEFKQDICNSAIICWHDSILFSAKAMIASFYDDEISDTHNDLKLLSETWQETIIDNELIISTFSLNVPTLVKKMQRLLLKTIVVLIPIH
ncbi:hypothetical protein KUL42_02580 [Alteromonas sp. KUL42]|uniref:hypothetical protein n=1 Tax=Alteromonas sp. KUL42 TaxID=2480797 RepID=UPI001036EABF|nr:hypothetical protein [Alteromonas sp. KUL42]TAP38263.1 hypothetical protein EYR97_01260 [Alteromonas sp. KUL42]GEA05497.1 hypothetical protein KUL42_02580 [Alteromonas sp. KUL42]